ncbi:MAG: amino acid--tRNA ligase-related protein, partial [Myxococcota bacterium]
MLASVAETWTIALLAAQSPVLRTLMRCEKRSLSPRPMKRLLAAGSGPIYQLAHAFRAGEVGSRHAPEFTMLEWYRPGFDHHGLMDEVEALVRALLPGLEEAPFERWSYRNLFLEHAAIDPFATTTEDLRKTCERL